MATTLHARTNRARRFTGLAHVSARSSLYERPIPPDLPDENPPGSPEPWHLVAAVRPDTPHVRAPRIIDAIGEAAAGFVLIVGGAVLTALATLL